MSTDPREPHDPQRRRLGRLVVAAGAAAALAGCSASSPSSSAAAAPPPPDPGPLPPMAADAWLAELERRSFDFFWETTNPANGLVPDRWPTPSFASVAAVGFGLTAYPVGVARGWISREQARERVLTTLRFFRDAPQGPQARGMTGHKGFFYHFLDMRDGARFADVELSTIDTALFVAGALHCAQFFDGADAAEAAIRSAARTIYERIDWPWAQPRPPAIGHGWKPETGQLASDYKGYNEAMLLYLLALGSPTHPVEADAWEGGWCSTYGRAWQTQYGQTLLHYPSLFTHQFTHIWVDFRGMPDAYLRARGLDYAENSRRATLAQQAYAIANPDGWAGYDDRLWGITACDGPVDLQREWNGRLRRFISYGGRGMGVYDDGTIAPYGAGSSIVFAPEIVVPSLVAMRERHGAHVVGRYGYYAFNRSFQFTDVTLTHGRVVPGFGWVDTDYLGIEVGPLLAMLANHRGELVWRAMRTQPDLLRGLRRAGFGGGWLA